MPLRCVSYLPAPIQLLNYSTIELLFRLPRAFLRGEVHPPQQVSEARLVASGNQFFPEGDKAALQPHHAPKSAVLPIVGKEPACAGQAHALPAILARALGQVQCEAGGRVSAEALLFAGVAGMVGRGFNPAISPFELSLGFSP